ncbi:hypothetical protein Leryth_025821 [Lithospermum erythrorhizon]|nr:hypothetical protein Leryth_025821 [Lithospermum erythrorhizon]
MDGVENNMEEIEAKEDDEEMELIEAVEDCKMILSQINKQAKKCRLKRRWLMALDLTRHERKRIKKLFPPKDGFLPESILRQDDELKLMQMSKLLRDPVNYDKKCVPELTTSQYRAAAMRILDGIDDFPVQALSCMHRRLRRVKGYTPQSQSRCGWSPATLAKQVRKKCMKFLSQLGEEAQLQPPLAHALAVANLTVKLRSRSAQLTEFRKVSPEIDALQNDIMKAIWLLDDSKKMSFEKVECLLHLLAPNVQTNNKIRILMRNLLTEYLFECADMDTIPKCLVESLDFVNKIGDEASCLGFFTEEIVSDVEGALSVSSQAKQIVWDFIPEGENDLDIEFANAYLDDMLESDDDYFSDDGHEGANVPGKDIDFDDICNGIEGFGESMPSCVNSPISAGDKIASTENGIKNMNDLDAPGKSGSQSPSSSCKQEENSHSIPANKYLSIQEACDNSGTVAHHLIGGLLTKFAEVGGLDLDQDNLSYLKKTSIGSSERFVCDMHKFHNF